MPVLTKSIYEPQEPTDGLRVLATAYWPRGIAKAKVDLYKRILGPNRDLLRSFKAGEIEWPAYRQAYLELMAGDDQQSEIAALAASARTDTITIMCTCKDDSECHRGVLRDLIDQAVREGA